MKFLRNIITVLLFSQLFPGCIALIPPGYIEPNKDTEIIIYETYPELVSEEPIFAQAPDVGTIQPTEKPKVEKYRRHEEHRAVEQKEQVVTRDSNARVRDNGERRGR